MLGAYGRLESEDLWPLPRWLGWTAESSKVRRHSRGVRSCYWLYGSRLKGGVLETVITSVTICWLNEFSTLIEYSVWEKDSFLFYYCNCDNRFVCRLKFNYIIDWERSLSLWRFFLDDYYSANILFFFLCLSTRINTEQNYKLDSVLRRHINVMKCLVCCRIQFARLPWTNNLIYFARDYLLFCGEILWNSNGRRQTYEHLIRDEGCANQSFWSTMPGARNEEHSERSISAAITRKEVPSRGPNICLTATQWLSCDASKILFLWTTKVQSKMGYPSFAYRLFG